MDHIFGTVFVVSIMVIFENSLITDNSNKYSVQLHSPNLITFVVCDTAGFGLGKHLQFVYSHCKQVPAELLNDAFIF